MLSQMVRKSKMSNKKMSPIKFLICMIFLSGTIVGIYCQFYSLVYSDFKTTNFIGMLNIFYTMFWYMGLFFVEWKKGGGKSE